MRTKGQQSAKERDQQTQDSPEATFMISQIKQTLHTSQSTLLQDAIGAASLVVMLLVALHFPGLT